MNKTNKTYTYKQSGKNKEKKAKREKGNKITRTTNKEHVKQRGRENETTRKREY